MTIESIVFLVIFLSANAYAAYKFSTLFKLATAATGTVWNGSRTDRLPERIATVLKNVLGQAQVLRNRFAGIAHTMIFWGFIIITFGTIELFVREVVPTASFEFIGTIPYGVLVGLQDFFSAFVLLGVLMMFYRRLVLRPPGIGQSAEAYFILVLTASLMISLMGMNAFRLIGAPQWHDAWMPVSRVLAYSIEGLALPPETAATISFVFKWAHLILVLGFLCYIPNSKHLHILASGPNTFHRTLDTARGMQTINLEAENATSFGATKVSDLSWKDTLDGYACTECGRCQDVCPAWNTQKPLSPKKLVLDLKHQLYDNKDALLARKFDDVKPIIGAAITEDIIWACTSCRACEEACPVFIEHTNKIYEVRRSLVLMESKFPPELQTVFKNMESNFSPWAMSPDERSNWAADSSVKKMADVAGEPLDYLFWVGCAGSFDDRNKKVSRALVNLMNKAGVKFAILGNEEKCTGDPARRMGNEYLAQMLIKENVATLNRYGVKKVVTACPHCFNAIKNEWKDFGGNYEVIHHTQLLAELIAKGALRPQKGFTESVTYHDSCYMGRWNGEYSAPRKLMESIPGVKITEMAKSANKSMCCGAGGGRMWMEEHIGARVNVTRTEQALETGAKIIAANCPFCMTMMTDGVKAKDVGDKVVVKDVAELLEQSLG